VYGLVLKAIELSAHVPEHVTCHWEGQKQLHIWRL